MSRDVWTSERLFFLASISYFLVDITERINVVFLDFSGPSCLVTDSNLLIIMFSRQKLEPLQISLNSVGMILYPTTFLPDKYGKTIEPNNIVNHHNQLHNTMYKYKIWQLLV